MRSNSRFSAVVFALLLMTVFTGSVMAQTETATYQTENATASAYVVAALTLAKDIDLDFKNVTPGNRKTITVAGAVAEGITTGGEKQAKFTVTKGINTWVTLKITTPSDLLASGGEQLEMQYSNVVVGENTYKLGLLSGSNGSSYAFAPADGSEATYELSQANIGTYGNFYGSDGFTVELGATAVPTSTQASGDYTGTINVNVEYN